MRSRWARDFNTELRELFHFDFDLPAVFIDTFHRKKSEHEVTLSSTRSSHETLQQMDYDLNKLLQVEMFLNNTLKLWEFAEGKLDSPFLCRDIQVAHFLQGYLKDPLCCPVVSKVVKDFAKLSNSLEVCQL